MFAYVNSIIFTGLLLYPELPRFVSVLVVFLALPIALVFVFRYLARVLIMPLKLKVRDAEELTSPLPIFSVTLALPMMIVLFADFAGGNYLQLLSYPVSEDVLIVDVENYTEAGYVSFKDGIVKLKNTGFTQNRTSRNNGTGRSVTLHSYYVYPVVARGWTSDIPVSIWLCESVSNPESMPSKFRDHPKIPELIVEKIQGTTIKDPYAIHSYGKAIENAAKRYNIKSVSNPLLLAYQDNPYPQLIDRQQQRFFVFLGIVNLLWVGGFGFLIFRDYKRKQKLKQEPNYQPNKDLHQQPSRSTHKTRQHPWFGAQAALASVFEFSVEDLSSNQLGRISAEQKTRMQQNNTSNNRFAWGAFATIFGIGFLGFSAAIIQNDEMGIDALPWYFVAVGFFALILWANILFHQYRLKRTHEKGIARAVSGTISLYSKRVERTTNYYFAINGQRFQIEQFKQFDAMKKEELAGQEATMYISSPWKSILSVELHEK
jgi:hypothetical protein